MDVALKDTLNANWKNDKNAFGFKMLQKMGWKEDQGLGKAGTGITTNIKVKRREEGLGLGMEKVTDDAGNKGWNATASSFNEVLDLLKQQYGDSTKKKKKEKRKPTAKIIVGMKYKKLTAAKDLSTKSEAEMKAILGAAVKSTSAVNSVSIQDQLVEEDAPRIKEKKRKREDKKYTVPVIAEASHNDFGHIFAKEKKKSKKNKER